MSGKIEPEAIKSKGFYCLSPDPALKYRFYARIDKTFHCVIMNLICSTTPTILLKGTKKGHCMSTNDTALEISRKLGERLKMARLNLNMTQEQVAIKAGLSRKIVGSAEKGKAQLESFIGILQALSLTDQLDLFIPPQEISPIQLAKLHGSKRQRASGSVTDNNGDYEW